MSEHSCRARTLQRAVCHISTYYRQTARHRRLSELVILVREDSDETAAVAVTSGDHTTHRPFGARARSAARHTQDAGTDGRADRPTAGTPTHMHGVVWYLLPTYSTHVTQLTPAHGWVRVSYIVRSGESTTRYAATDSACRVCRAPPTLAVSVRASYPHRLGDGSNLGPCPRIRGPFGVRSRG